MTGFVRRLVAVATVAAVLTGLSAGPAEAAQHQNANVYVNWNFSGATGFWNTDQRVQVVRKAHHSYWAMVWDFTATAGEGGYVGLQTSARRPDGSTGDIALFSLWNANGASGSSCGQFGGEGTGWSCRLAYPVAEGGDYRYRVWRLDADAQGQWWGAWMLDVRTGVDRQIGAIRVAPGKTLMTPPRNFSEYWGDQVGCDAVPQSVVLFTQPAANQQQPGSYQYGSRYSSWSRGSCTGGGVTVTDLGWTKAARTTLGGAR